MLAKRKKILKELSEEVGTSVTNLSLFKTAIVQQAPFKYTASCLGITDSSLIRIRKEVARRS